MQKGNFLMQENGALGRRKAATRQDILDAAERLFSEVGYENTSMDSIAIAAGVSRKTLFNYVESKPALIHVLVRRRFSDPYTAPYKESHELRTETAKDLLPQFGHSLQAVFDNRWLLRLGVEHANLFSSDEAGAAFELEPSRDARVARARALQQLGKLRADVTAECIVRQFEILRNAVFREWLRKEDATLAELRQRMAEVMDLMIHGIAPK